MKMRELERRTGVSRQMVQFYLAHGLLPEPERPKPNVALYSEEHVRAIEVIRRLQTEGRLRIQEIKQALNGTAPHLPADVAVLPHLDELFALRAGVDNQRVPLTSIEARNPQAAADASILARLGAITLEAAAGGTGAELSRLDAQIVGLWGDMRAAGFTEDVGFDPTIVQLYLKAAREIAAAEIEIFVSRVSPSLPVERRAAMANTASKLMLDVFTILRMKAEVEAFRAAESVPVPDPLQAGAAAGSGRKSPRKTSPKAGAPASAGAAPAQAAGKRARKASPSPA